MSFVDAYVVIGWGSLIWDSEMLAPQLRGDWEMSGGPRLPMEFSRISPKRKLSLVVALDPAQGGECDTHVIASIRADIGAAARDLAARERAPLAHIGAVCLRTEFVRSASAPIAERVRGWCASVGAHGAVWTDLPTNFAEKTGTPFSLERGCAYLRSLTGESLAEAVRYIDNAPAATDTPLRRRLGADPWWRGLPRDH